MFKTLYATVVLLLASLPASLPANAENLQTAIFAGGCFWCVESDFDQVDGVRETVSGYTGGTLQNPTYRQVGRGDTGHYEAVAITFDADIVTYDQLAHAFFRSIDPTDAGGQFCDRGATYRTAAFVSDAQRPLAEAAKRQAQADLGAPIVTEILPAVTFWPAEGYHQNYYRTNAQRYNYYRNGCGRDQRVFELWGAAAPFVHH